MTGNFDINKELLDAMRIIARQEIEKCNRDITKTARVINVNNDKTIKIEMDGKQYDNIPNYNGTTLSVNNIVKVTYPQGQASNMYVSGGGEDEIYSNIAVVTYSKSNIPIAAGDDFFANIPVDIDTSAYRWVFPILSDVSGYNSTKISINSCIWQNGQVYIKGNNQATGTANISLSGIVIAIK